MRISWVWSNRKRQKKLVPKDIHINNIVDMLIDNSPSPPSSVVVVSTNSGRNEESISSTVNTTPLVVRDQVPNQQTLRQPLPLPVLLDIMYSFETWS